MNVVGLLAKLDWLLGPSENGDIINLHHYEMISGAMPYF
jgi:hypothetical protein